MSEMVSIKRSILQSILAAAEGYGLLGKEEYIHDFADVNELEEEKAQLAHMEAAVQVGVRLAYPGTEPV